MRTPNATWISDWNPEDPTFWNTKGKVIALRNLIWCNGQCAWGGQRAIATTKAGRTIPNWPPPMNQIFQPKGAAPLRDLAMTLQSNLGAIVRSAPIFLGPDPLAC